MRTGAGRDLRVNKLFVVGDLVMDKDVFNDGIDLALVLETPEIAGYYKVYYCTGPVAGEMVLETVGAMQNFRLVSKRSQN